MKYFTFGKLQSRAFLMGFDLEKAPGRKTKYTLRDRTTLQVREFPLLKKVQDKLYHSRDSWKHAKEVLEMADKNGIKILEHEKNVPRIMFLERAGIVKDKQLMKYYHQEHDRCMCCGVRRGALDKDEFFVRLEIHHIIGAGCRSDERCNLLMLCQSCHGTNKVLGGPMSLGVALQLKHIATPHECDWVRMAQLRHALLPCGEFDMRALKAQERNAGR